MSASHPLRNVPPWVALLGAGVLGGIATLVILDHDRSERHDAHDARKSALDARAVAATAEVSEVFWAVYQGARTIARLPGVRAIDPVAGTLAPEDADSLQEVYNSLAYRVAMSEVYLVPLDMDPDRPDAPHREPWLTFDQLIVGRLGGAKDGVAAHKEVEEVETFEYRAMRDQLAWFKAHAASESSIQGLDYPLRVSAEVVTCDNSRYDPAHPDDRDRSGLVLSVPMYGADGALKGMVSAVILSGAVRDLLPAGPELALGSPTLGWFARADGGDAWDAHRETLVDGETPLGLAVFSTHPVPLPPGADPWVVWAGESPETYAASVEVSSTRSERHYLLVLAWTLSALAGTLGWSWLRGRRRRARLAAHAAALRDSLDELGALALEFSKDADEAALRTAAVAERARRMTGGLTTVSDKARELEAARRDSQHLARTGMEAAERGLAAANALDLETRKLLAVCEELAQAGTGAPEGVSAPLATRCDEVRASAHRLGSCNLAVRSVFLAVEATLHEVTDAARHASGASITIAQIAGDARADSRGIGEDAAVLLGKAERSREHGGRARRVAATIREVADRLGG